MLVPSEVETQVWFSPLVGGGAGGGGPGAMGYQGQGLVGVQAPLMQCCVLVCHFRLRHVCTARVPGMSPV